MYESSTSKSTCNIRSKKNKVSFRFMCPRKLSVNTLFQEVMQVDVVSCIESEHTSTPKYLLKMYYNKTAKQHRPL